MSANHGDLKGKPGGLDYAEARDWLLADPTFGKLLPGVKLFQIHWSNDAFDPVVIRDNSAASPFIILEMILRRVPGAGAFPDAPDTFTLFGDNSLIDQVFNWGDYHAELGAGKIVRVGMAGLGGFNITAFDNLVIQNLGASTATLLEVSVIGINHLA